MTSLAIANRGLKVRHKFWIAYPMFPTSVGNGVEWPYRATDAEHPVFEQHRDGLRPFSHDIVNRHVLINLQAVPPALSSRDVDLGRTSNVFSNIDFLVAF